MKENSKAIEQTGNYAAIISLSEIGLGSLLHSLKIPFSGHFLSLNQGFILIRSIIKNKDKLHTKELKKLPYNISLVTALLKSLSPAGKKLTPMLGISMQGFLFSSALFTFGINYFGLILGMLILSLWAFIQPFAIYYILMGNDLIFMLNYYSKKLASFGSIPDNILWWVVLALVTLKLVLAFVVSLIAINSKKEKSTNYFVSINSIKENKKQNTQSPLVGSLKDITQPFFLFSIAFLFVFYYFSKSNLSEVIISLLRPICVGFIFFYIIRKVPVESWSRKLHGTRWEPIGKSLEIALKKIS